MSDKDRVDKVSPKKRLKKEWRKQAKGKMSLKTWARSVHQAGEDKLMCEYIEAWLLNKGTVI